MDQTLHNISNGRFSGLSTYNCGLRFLALITLQLLVLSLLLSSSADGMRLNILRCDTGWSRFLYPSSLLLLLLLFLDLVVPALMGVQSLE